MAVFTLIIDDQHGDFYGLRAFTQAELPNIENIICDALHSARVQAALCVTRKDVTSLRVTARNSAEKLAMICYANQSRGADLLAVKANMLLDEKAAFNDKFIECLEILG